MSTTTAVYYETEEEDSNFVQPIVNQTKTSLQRILEIEESSEIVKVTPKKQQLRLYALPVGMKMSREAKFGLITQAGPRTKRKRSRLNFCGNCERKIEFHERNCIAECGHRLHMKCAPSERFVRTAAV